MRIFGTFIAGLILAGAAWLAARVPIEPGVGPDAEIAAFVRSLLEPSDAEIAEALARVDEVRARHDAIRATWRTAFEQPTERDVRAVFARLVESGAVDAW